MAKKNLSSLMSGIMGQPDSEESGAPSPTHTAGSNEVKTEGKRKRGRPRNKNSEIYATFLVNPEHIRKMKYINLIEGNFQKDIIDAALRQYFRQWEAKNGKINLPDRK